MFARYQADANYADGSPLPQAFWEAVDAALAAAVNGDGGGTYANLATTVAGAGMWFGGPTSVGGTSSSFVASSVGHPLILGDSDYPLYTVSQAPTSRVIVVNPGRAFSAQRWTNVSSTPTFSALGGFQTTSPNQIVRVPLDVVHQLSTFDEVQVIFFVGTDHTSTGVPAQLPRARMLRVDAVGNEVVMSSTGAGADANGYFVVSTPASGAAWYAAGALQTLYIFCDVDNVVDGTLYTYWLEWIDESSTHAFAAGINAGNGVAWVQHTVIDIADERPGIY